MDRFEIIEALEGREIQTPDSRWHLVKSGEFPTRDGYIVRLIDVLPGVLEAYYRNARQPRQWLDDIISEANRSGRIFSRLGRQTKKGHLAISSTQRGYLVMEVWQRGLPRTSLTLGFWSPEKRQWEEMPGVLDKVDAWKVRAEELLEDGLS